MVGLRVFCPYASPDSPAVCCDAPLTVYCSRDGEIEDFRGACPHVKAFHDEKLDVTLLEAACDEAAWARTVERD